MQFSLIAIAVAFASLAAAMPTESGGLQNQGEGPSHVGYLSLAT